MKSRSKWLKVIRAIIRKNKWENWKDAIRFEKAYGHHGKWWQRVPTKNLSRYNSYKRRKVGPVYPRGVKSTVRRFEEPIDVGIGRPTWYKYVHAGHLKRKRDDDDDEYYIDGGKVSKYEFYS